MVTQIVEEFEQSFLALDEKIQTGLQDLRSFSTAKADFETNAAETQKRLTDIDGKIVEAAQAITAADATLKSTRQYVDDTFCTKTTHDAAISKLETAATETNTKVSKGLDDLETVKATKTEVEEVRTSVRTSLGEIKNAVSQNTSAIDQTKGSLMAFEQRVEQNYATRQMVEENAKNLVEEVCQRSDTREELGRVWKDIEAEKERLRQTVRLQQRDREDINQMIDDVQSLKNGASELGGRCDSLDASLNGIDGREITHFENSQEALKSQKVKIEDIEDFCKTLKNELVKELDDQKAQAERLKDDSTKRYLEQIDKAIELSKSVDSVKKRNDELNDSMSKIKLPALAAQ